MEYKFQDTPTSRNTYVRLFLQKGDEIVSMEDGVSMGWLSIVSRDFHKSGSWSYSDYILNIQEDVTPIRVWPRKDSCMHLIRRELMGNYEAIKADLGISVSNEGLDRFLQRYEEEEWFAEHIAAAKDLTQGQSMEIDSYYIIYKDGVDVGIIGPQLYNKTEFENVGVKVLHDFGSKVSLCIAEGTTLERVCTNFYNDDFDCRSTYRNYGKLDTYALGYRYEYTNKGGIFKKDLDKSSCELWMG